MKKLITVALFLLSFSGLTQAADLAAGKTKAAPCVACHGTDGNSANPIWPKLAGQNVAYLEKQMMDFKHGPARIEPTMNGMILSVKEEDFADIAAFFASNETTRQIVDEKYVELGQKIYRAGDAKRQVTACIACHGPAGQGMAAAKFPALAGQHPVYIINQLKAFRDNKRTNDVNSIMRNVTAMMSDAQIEAVANYVAGLHQ